MKLMQSICCLFSGRCASEAPEAPGGDAHDAVKTRDASAAPQKSPRAANPETEDFSSGSTTN